MTSSVTPGLSANPFRNLHANPQSASQGGSISPTVALPQPQRSGTLLSDDIPDDAPPAYTPTPDPRRGEETVELGPRRPFQQAPQVAQVAVVLQPNQNSGSNNTGIGQQTEQAVPIPQPLATVFSPPSGRPPPPGHPAVATPPPPRHPSTASSPSHQRHSSSATALPPPRHPSIASSHQRAQSHSPSQQTVLSAPVPSPSTQTSSRPPEASPRRTYSPPPDPAPRSLAPSSPPRPVASTSPGSRAALDDHQPTTTPMPGHPLLRDGKLLVYPVGYECHKCRNTGFKNHDPSHPCRKCWNRFAKPYAGAHLYAPAAPNGTASNFQRPLPSFRPPQFSHPSAMCRARPGFPLGPLPTPIFTGPMGPPPGSIVVNPGDPRIGGRLCWRCGGRGNTTFMIFDQETCEVCNGVGRVF